MITAYLIRHAVTSEYTRGVLFVEGHVFHTIERPWLDNQSNISCIPAGVYDVSFLKRSASGKYKNVYHVLEVPDRFGILEHNGNLVRHTRGCIIVGMRAGVLGGKAAVLNSRTAMRKLVELIGDEPSKLHIIGNQ